MQEIEATIKHYIAENILFSPNYPHSDEDSFVEHGVIDSMNILELVVFLEERMEVQVEDHEINPDNFDSISRLATYVKRKKLLAV